MILLEKIANRPTKHENISNLLIPSSGCPPND